MPEKNNKKQLTDKQLKKTSGGWAQYHGLTWKYDIGDHVEIKTGWFLHQFTDGGEIRHLAVLNTSTLGFQPGYYVDGDSAGWYLEDDFNLDHRHPETDAVHVLV